MYRTSPVSDGKDGVRDIEAGWMTAGSDPDSRDVEGDLASTLR